MEGVDKDARDDELWVEDFLHLRDSVDEDFDFFCDLGRGGLLSIHPSLNIKGGVFGVTVKAEQKCYAEEVY